MPSQIEVKEQPEKVGWVAEVVGSNATRSISINQDITTAINHASSKLLSDSLEALMRAKIKGKEAEGNRRHCKPQEVGYGGD